MASLSLLLVIIQVFLYAQAAHIRSDYAKKPTCGYESCPTVDPKKLNVHLVAHTHDDVGWLKTVDQYYFGSRSMIQKAGVQYIIDTVIEALRDHPDRRFIYVETSFLWKWWQRQDEKTKEEVKSFINDGRLEIIGGGWSMNDEAATHYHSLIDQYTWGFRRLNDTFGQCARPKIGWQIDPFGHSREQASMFAQMGFDGLFLGRLDYQDKAKRLANKTAEFIWQASPNLGSAADLFTGVLFNNYSPPPGFCFDILCADEPMIDDPDSPDNNIDARVKSFVDYIHEQAPHYRTNSIALTMGGDFTYQQAQMTFTNLDKLIRYIADNGLSQVELFRAFCQVQARSYQTNNIVLTMGEDFNYQDARMWFINLDKLIRYTNEKHGSEINVFYSTPSCYLKSLNEANISWSTKTDDFFPYASDPHAYWTGYFSSRPTLKYYERLGNNFLQIVKQLSVLTGANSDDPRLDYFREAMGIMQHHDAVTGTEKQHVAEDYARILANGMDYGAEIASEALSKWMVKDKTTDSKSLPKFNTCMHLNVSACEYSEDNTNFVFTIYNPRSQAASQHVRIPVQGSAYDVKDPTGTEILSQLVPIPRAIAQIPERISVATNELVFLAVEIPPLGYKSFYISKKLDAPENFDESPEVSSIGGEFYNISVNDAGRVVVEWKKGNPMRLEQSFHYYEGAEGNNMVFVNRSSGAYIFRPKTAAAVEIAYSGSYKFYTGPVVEELHQTVNEWISQVVRVYVNQDRIEFDWVVGPIPTDSDKIGKEIITKYSSNLASGGEFYTDSNSREMIKRQKDHRPTWDLKLEEPVAGNYYPVTSRICLKDDKRGKKLTVLTDRAQGGSSLQDGELELMVHRRLLKDDAFGVGEALNETAYGKGLIATGQHFIFGLDLDDADGSALKEKIGLAELALKPWYPIVPANDISFEQWSSKFNMKGDGLKFDLPPNVQILTLEPWKEDSVLLRLEHIFEIQEAAKLSQPVEVNIQELFAPFTIQSVHETILGGNQWIEDSQRLKWDADTNDLRRFPSNNFSAVTVSENAINVLMKPMEIRTFVVNVSRV